DLETTCQPAGPRPGSPLPARVRNISQSGINLVLGREFQSGDLLRVTLPGGGEVSEVLACVVRARALEAGRWGGGCTFGSELSDEDLARFGARRMAAPASDQRGWVRFDCQARAVYQVVRSPEAGEDWRAQVLNISASGLAMKVDQPLVPGDLLSVELRRD